VYISSHVWIISGSSKLSLLCFSQRLLRGELVFPDRTEVDGREVPARKISIPVTFTDVAEYKRIFNVALKGISHCTLQLPHSH
jgi:hypothetical protein